MDQFLAKAATGPSVLQIEGLIRTALFRKGADIVGYLLQAAAEEWRESLEASRLRLTPILFLV